MHYQYIYYIQSISYFVKYIVTYSYTQIYSDLLSNFPCHDKEADTGSYITCITKAHQTIDKTLTQIEINGQHFLSRNIKVNENSTRFSTH